jgi:hypothetical protein
MPRLGRNLSADTNGGFASLSKCDSVRACARSMPCSDHCATAWTGFRTSAAASTPPTRWATSAWWRSRCSSCKARPSRRISASSRQAMGTPTAPACSASPRSPVTITSATCSTRPRRCCYIRCSLRRPIRSGTSMAAWTCSAGSTGACWLRSTAPSITARARSPASTARPGSEARARSSIITACWPPRRGSISADFGLRGRAKPPACGGRILMERRPVREATSLPGKRVCVGG